MRSSACRAVEVADQGMFFAAANGDLTFLSRQDTWTTTRNITAQATFGEADYSETPMEDPLRYDGASLDYAQRGLRHLQRWVGHVEGLHERDRLR